MSRSTMLLLAVLLSAPGWWAMRQATPPLFTRLSPTETGVTFTNRIDETDSLHIFRYEYLYNGNGVGVGDFNNDGRPDLFFSGNTVPHKLYLNLTGSRQPRSDATRSDAWRFSDVTAASGVAGNGTWGTGVSVVDINADGLLDVYVCHSGKFTPDKLVNELFVNQGVTDGVPRFREMARQYGLDLPGTQTTQAAFLDYDRDGDLDAFILNHSNHTFNPLLNTRRLRATPDMQFGNRLLRNDNGQFTDVTLAEGIVNNPVNFGLGVGVGDLNNDGWPDLYTTSDYTEQDCLYLNQHDAAGHHTGFQETIRSSMGHTSKFSMGCDIADYNNDTLPDVVTLDMLPADNHRQKMLKGPDDYDAYKLLIDSGYVRQQMRNMLQLNQSTDPRGQLRFSELGQLAGVSATDWSWSALLADFDNDGWKDLFVSNGYLRDFTDLDFMKYTVADAKLAEAAKGNLNFQTLDLVHKMPSNRLTNYLFRNNHDLTFSNQSAAWGIDQPAVSGASAYADFDGDGDLDLVVCHQNEPVSLYRNNAEQQAEAGHFARIRLSGAGSNTQALGARVVLETTAGRQLQFVSPTRGYQASVETTLHFGIGDATTIKRLTVYWPNGQQTQQTNLPADQTIQLRQTDASTAVAASVGSTPTLFRPLPMRSLLPYRHRENDFVDFKVEVLIPYQLSRLGPALAAGDVNGDGLDDVYIGGAVGQAGELWIQQSDGRFTQTQQTLAERSSEDVNALFFDADRDGDLDLYVVSGGNEYEAGAAEYQDRLYRNDGRGTFGAAEPGALPAMRDSKLALAAADYDGDGDLDLFVGGRGKAGSFPAPSVSYLLRNDTPTNGSLRFTDVTDTVAHACRLAGMVQAAAWADLDGDKQPELVLAGDWMPVRIFKNQQGVLTEQTQSADLSDYTGLWAALLLTDIDKDGDVDIVAGNAGLNNPFRASASEPMSVVAGDIDKDGVIDPIWTYYVQGKPYPAASRDELLDQVVPLRKRFTRYHHYADATVETLLNESARAKATTVEVRELASGVFLNQGNGTFRFNRFPVEAQLSRASSLLTDDIDGDGETDLLLAGNFYPYRVQHGPCDASFGTVLRGTGSGTFSPLPPRQSGFWAGGDVRTGVSVRTIGGRRRYFFAVNDAPLIGFER